MTDLIPFSDPGQHINRVIEAANLAAGSKRKYRRAVHRYLDDGGRLTDPDQLASYAAGLPTSIRAHLKAAVKLWSDAMIDQVKRGATPVNVATVQATIYRFEALQTAVTVPATKGEKAHVWLSRSEVMQLMDTAAGDGVQQLRDRLALALLVGAGQRRNEVVNLRFDDVTMQPVNGRLRTVLSVAGKGAKNRVVPVSDRLASMIDLWATAVGGSGLVLRSVDKGGNVGDSLSAAGLFDIVRTYGRLLAQRTTNAKRAAQLARLAPHDLRRTYAQIGYESGVPITQISKLLGHASVATTQRYLNLDLDLETTISDFVPV